ncbi:MAG: hypothetical protein RL757_1843 [Bacteroidota bacterium]
MSRRDINVARRFNASKKTHEILGGSYFFRNKTKMSVLLLKNCNFASENRRSFYRVLQKMRKVRTTQRATPLN